MAPIQYHWTTGVNTASCSRVARLGNPLCPRGVGRVVARPSHKLAMTRRWPRSRPSAGTAATRLRTAWPSTQSRRWRANRGKRRQGSADTTREPLVPRPHGRCPAMSSWGPKLFALRTQLRWSQIHPPLPAEKERCKPLDRGNNKTSPNMFAQAVLQSARTTWPDGRLLSTSTTCFTPAIRKNVPCLLASANSVGARAFESKNGCGKNRLGHGSCHTGKANMAFNSKLWTDRASNESAPCFFVRHSVTSAVYRYVRLGGPCMFLCSGSMVPQLQQLWCRARSGLTGVPEKVVPKPVIDSGSFQRRSTHTYIYIIILYYIILYYIIL